MRASFVATLANLARRDPRIFLLTGDLGYGSLEPFAGEFPDRFVNVGVAEQNMVGIATGLAEAGFVPFVYSIVTFACLRPYEFIRNGPLMHRLPVRVVGVGGGMEYAHDGLTHYGLEDLAVMRAQPAMCVIAPADHRQAAAALEATYDLPGPIYYRLGKDDRTVVAGLENRFTLGRAEVVQEGADVLVVTAGAIAAGARRTAQHLEAKGWGCRVLVVSTLNPAPVEDLLGHLRLYRRVMTVESHYRAGGLGSLVAEVIADHGLGCALLRCAVETMPDGRTGSLPFLERLHGLDDDSLAKRALRFLHGDGRSPHE